MLTLEYFEDRGYPFWGSLEKGYVYVGKHPRRAEEFEPSSWRSH